MSVARNSIFTEKTSLFDKACTEDGCKTIRNDEMMQILAEKFNVDRSVFETSELFEAKVLRHILAVEKDVCSSIPADFDVTGNASWHAMDAFYDSALVVRYPGLSLAQREQVVEAYNKHYGPIATTYETLYAGGFCRDNLDGIMFNKARFCKNVLNNLVDVAVEQRNVAGPR